MAEDRPTAEDLERFRKLEDRLPALWKSIARSPDYEHTVVVVPSLSVDHDELAKIEGSPHYEERLLFSLMRLRHPSAQVIYVTSQPVHPDIVDYYLHLLPGIPWSHARRRLTLLSVQDGAAKPLTDKILERPLLQKRIRRIAGRADRSYITCFNTTDRERRLALALGMPLNGVDPSLLELGSKSGAREVFTEAGIPHPAGFEHLRGKDDIVEALGRLRRDNPDLRRAVVKFDHSFSGEGNALFVYPEEFGEDADADRAALETGLAAMGWSAPGENLESYLGKFGEMGGIVEEFIEGEEKRSPSVQMRVQPGRQLELVSTHDQILGGPTGQVYLGCRFPADEVYRERLVAAAVPIGRVLRDRGVLGRFGIDFIATPGDDGDWNCHAIEINLRMGGTTPPFLALQFLTDGAVDDDGNYVSRNGKHKFYRATDHLKAPHYRGLMVEDLIEHTVRQRLGYDASTETGVVFHMLGALSRYGKLGLTAIGDSPDEAEELFEKTVAALDDLAGARPGGRRQAPMQDKHWTGIE